MFYAKSLLSMEVKSDISLIYYVSTTNSIRRITKNEINKIDLNNTLVAVLDQAFALRLYGFILRGVSKIYMLKMKYHENEVAGLLSMLKIHYSTARREIKKKVQDWSSEESDDIYDGGIINKYKDINKKNSLNFQDINYDISNHDINYEIPSSFIIKKEIIDDEIELNNRQCIKRVKKSTKSYNFISVRDYPIFKLFQIKNTEKKDSVEIYRNRTSSNIPSQIITEEPDFSHTFFKDQNYNYNIPLMCESQSDLLVQNCDSSISKIKLLDLIGNEGCFNEIAYGTRQFKAELFYDLLDLLSKNIIEARQETPYSDIYIMMIFN